MKIRMQSFVRLKRALQRVLPGTQAAFRSANLRVCVGAARPPVIEAVPTQRPKTKKRNMRKEGPAEVTIHPRAVGVPQDMDPASLPKRMVALHVGYVGTNYRGAVQSTRNVITAA